MLHTSRLLFSLYFSSVRVFAVADCDLLVRVVAVLPTLLPSFTNPIVWHSGRPLCSTVSGRLDAYGFGWEDLWLLGLEPVRV